MVINPFGLMSAYEMFAVFMGFVLVAAGWESVQFADYQG